MRKKGRRQRRKKTWSLRRFLHLIRSFMRKMANDRIDVYSAQSAFYLVMSLVPVLMMAVFILRYTPLNEQAVIGALDKVLQAEALETVSSIVRSVYAGTSAIATFTMIITFWTAGRGVMGLANGLNTIFHLKETRNYLILRLRSSFYTILLVFALILSLVMLIFIGRINEYIGAFFPLFKVHNEMLRIIAVLAGLPLLTWVFVALYVLLPSGKKAFRTQIWGAVFTTVSWVVFTAFFMLYLRLSKNLTLVYGGLLTIMMTMMWLYWCLYLFFFGAELNAWIENPDSFPF